MQQKLRVVFMGTPVFAATQLQAIVNAGIEVVAVVTVPDKPAGRGQKIHQSAVKEFALALNIPLLQPLRLKDEVFLQELKSYEANLFVVVAFRMLPEVVWQMPELGTINLHASLLPQYRGAAPINHAIIQGETHTGVTTFFIEQKIDTGKIILSEKVDIAPNDNAGILHDKLMTIGAEVLVRTLHLIENKQVTGISQEHCILQEKELKTAPKIFKEDCKIDWTRSVSEIHNLIRGLAPYPCAYTLITNKRGQTLKMKIFASRYTLDKKNEIPIGEIVVEGKSQLKVSVSDGWLYIDEMQLEGKKQMSSNDFLRGYLIDDSRMS